MVGPSRSRETEDPPLPEPDRKATMSRWLPLKAFRQGSPLFGNDVVDDDLSEGIAREELSGLAYMFWGRIVVLGFLALWVFFTLPLERSGAYLLAIVTFALLGAPPYLLARRGLGGNAVTAVFLLLDAGVLCLILLVPPPFYVEGWTPQINLRLPNILYAGIFLVGMALSYSPTLVVWTGLSLTAAWAAGYLWIASLPGSVTNTSRQMLDGGFTPEEVIRRFLDPQSVSLTVLTNQVIFLLLITSLLTLAVWRSRRLLRRQVAAEAQRSALSRYFSPNIVRELSTSGDALIRPERHQAAVLFADMVGFTGLSEGRSPEALMGLLSEFHGRLARTAFAHDGTVDKYIGDAIMVHFGTPRTRDDDPVRALSCAVAMIADIESWSRERQRFGSEPIHLGIGVHYGDVLVGNIGDERRLEYTILGDAVNVASRLERLTREIGCTLVVSDNLVRAVRQAGGDPAAIAPALKAYPARTVRGRKAPVAIWCDTEPA
ncbi:adenylate/guanylate cyclase domain-containing protein [Rhodobium gokarnense]|uniref:Adenylate cyclase n=1 Tax=Rhodobium gokarnense TaxID=364296 RepID=A0ABT3H7J4_9HYPH|nr:adenylate/guanylate cyclase domain-containing protein [Rhodobium gokarnense]MCW2306353.1 adenylate cyclase [Rhodobium gokarnense]